MDRGSTRRIATFAVCAAVAALACSDDPSGPEVEAPTLSFSTTAWITPFFESGTTDPPTVAWNGETGALTLAAAPQGVSIDGTTGVVTWDRSLPLGANTFEVVATNSAGSARVVLTLDSEFQGDFTGGYNVDPGIETTEFDFEMDFGADGSVTVLDVGVNTGAGTWTRTGSTVTAVYSYNDGVSFFTVQGDVTNSATEAVLEGFWYRGDGAPAGGEQGYLRVSITP